MEKQGVFYAVSVGPGDPELLTHYYEHAGLAFIAAVHA